MSLMPKMINHRLSPSAALAITRPRATARNSTHLDLNLKANAVMSTKLSFFITAPQAAGKRPPVRRHQALAAPSGMSIRAKMIITAALVVLALLYAKTLTLMIDAPDKPNPYMTFLHRAD
jgi:hypothetical protein